MSDAKELHKLKSRASFRGLKFHVDSRRKKFAQISAKQIIAILESSDEAALAYELKKSGLAWVTYQFQFPDINDSIKRIVNKL